MRAQPCWSLRLAFSLLLTLLSSQSSACFHCSRHKPGTVAPATMGPFGMCGDSFSGDSGGGEDGDSCSVCTLATEDPRVRTS